MACNWLIRISSHCPNLVRIGCNAKILSRFKVYGVMHDPIRIGFDAKELIKPHGHFEHSCFCHTLIIVELCKRQKNFPIHGDLTKANKALRFFTERIVN